MDELWTIERALWIEGTDAYEAHLDERCLMVFPQMGVLKRPAVLEGIAHGPRWSRVTFAGQQTVTAGSTAILAYLADAQREGEPFYRAHCSSTYVHGPHGWRMLCHHQTPTA